MSMYPVVQLDTLELMSRHCPKSISAYAICLGHADDEGNCQFTRDQIVHDLSESYARFRNHLKALAREGILEWHEMGDTLVITLAGIGG